MREEQNKAFVFLFQNAVISSQSEKITKKDAINLLFSLILQKILQMKMILRKIFTLLAALTLTMGAYADINPIAEYIDESQKEAIADKDNPDISGEAPLHVRFTANPSALDPGASLEWHIRNDLSGLDLIRYEENFEFDFTNSGKNIASLLVKLDNETVDSVAFIINISESHLEMPNAFSPNNDGHNEKYGAKGVNDASSTGHYKSIVDFHAYIFNRWGQKIYEWHDVAGWWDGTHNGNPVPDGVYYVLVKARGAEGREYNIRRDINLIRKFNEVTDSSNE